MFGSVSLKVYINIQVYFSSWCAPPLTMLTINIKQGSLKMKDFKNANIPHFKVIKREPVDILEDILNDKYPAEMLTKCFQVQAFYPT